MSGDMCSVCGDVTLNHAHYGAIVCNSCRIFFRRAVGRKEKWRCKNGDLKCSILMKVRTNCKQCRYNRCLQAGMKPDLVDKTKKAIEEYFNEVKEKEKGEVFEPSTPEEAVRPQSKGPDNPGLRTPSPVSLECRLITGEFTADDLIYFSAMSKSWKQFLFNAYEMFRQSEECLIEFEKIGRQALAIKARRTNRLSYRDVFDNKLKNVLWENGCALVNILVGASDASQVERVSYRVLSCFEVYNLFDFNAGQNGTIKELVESYGIVKISELPFRDVIPLFLHDTSFPSILSTSLFCSPWAQTLEMEQFFLDTAEAFRSMVQSNQGPALRVLQASLLLSSCAAETNTSFPLLNHGLLLGIIFKELLRKTGDSSLANRYLRQMLEVVENIKLCSDILARASFMKTTEEEEVDVDMIQVQNLAD